VAQAVLPPARVSGSFYPDDRVLIAWQLANMNSPAGATTGQYPYVFDSE